MLYFLPHERRDRNVNYRQPDIHFLSMHEIN